MKIILFINIALIAVIAGCIGPEPVISPTHFDRSPVPIGLSAILDSTAEGRAYVNLNWNITDNSKVRYYEVFRLKNRETAFQRVGTPQVTTLTDSTIVYSDTLLYFVRTLATDLFISGHSDTIRIQSN